MPNRKPMTGLILQPHEVRAVLATGKVTVRRVVRYIPLLGEPSDWCHKADRAQSRELVGDYRRFSPFVPGDRRFVKETWHAGDEWDGTKASEVDPLCGGCDLWYPADGSFADPDLPHCTTEKPKGYGKCRPSIHMPEWASRLTIVNVSTRVEQLHEITEDDVLAAIDNSGNGSMPIDSAFAYLWDSTHSKPEHKWAANPFVFVGEFEKEDAR